MVQEGSRSSPGHENLSCDQDNIVGSGSVDPDESPHQGEHSAKHDESILRDRYRVEIESLCTSYSLAQKEKSLLTTELAKARQTLEEQSLQAEQTLNNERLQHEQAIKSVKEQSMKVQQEYQKHMLDPKVKALFRKYLRLSNPSKGVTFARYFWPGPGHRDFFSLEKKKKSATCSSVLNEIRLQSRTKILYGKYQSLLAKHKEACNQVNHLKGSLRKKYQKEFDSIVKEFEMYSTQINLLAEKVDCLKEENKSLSLKLSQEITRGKQQERRIEDLKISERLITNKYRNTKRNMEEQNSKDIEMKMFLQSCLYSMKKSNRELQHGQMPISFDRDVKALLEKAQSAGDGIDTKNLSTSDVHAFVSLVVQRMNSL